MKLIKLFATFLITTCLTVAYAGEHAGEAAKAAEAKEHAGEAAEKK